MNREAQDTLLLFVGVMVLQVAITDLHLRYVKPQMQPLLLIAGAVLTALAVVSIVRSQRRSRAADPVHVPEQVATPSPSEHVPGGALGAVREPAHSDDGDMGAGQAHSHMPRTSWLLALPLLVLTVVTPPSLGAYAAARGGTTVIDAPTDGLPALPEARNGAVDLTLTEYSTRALYAPDTLRGEAIRLTGFVLPEDGGWSLARISLSCCAADGRPIKVQALGQEPPPADTWVELVGRFTPPDETTASRRTARFDVDRLDVVEAPTQQYE